MADPDLELRGGGGGGLDFVALLAFFPSVISSSFAPPLVLSLIAPAILSLHLNNSLSRKLFSDTYTRSTKPSGAQIWTQVYRGLGERLIIRLLCSGVQY